MGEFHSLSAEAADGSVAAELVYQLAETQLAIEWVAERTSAMLGALLNSRPRYSHLGLYLTHPYYGLQRSGQLLSKRFEGLVAALVKPQAREPALREVMKELLEARVFVSEASYAAVLSLMDVSPRSSNAARIASLLTQILTESSWISVRSNEAWIEAALTKVYGKGTASLHREVPPWVNIEPECQRAVKQIGRLARCLLPLRVEGVAVRAEVEALWRKTKGQGSADYIAAQVLRQLGRDGSGALPEKSEGG